MAKPAFQPTSTQRRIVREMKSVGEIDDSIAAAIGIDRNTLRKYFLTELDHGVFVQRREIVGLLYASARKGNVSAQKHLEELTRIEAAGNRRTEEKAPKLGKKESADIDAQVAHQETDWKGLVN